MKTNRLAIFGKIIAIAILILGIIHVVATFTPLIQGGLACLSPGALKAMTYMSLICGSAFILSGLIIFLLLQHIGDHPFLATPVLIIGIFLGISGILSIVYMFGNPFAWLALLLNITMFVVSVILKIGTSKK